MRRGAIAAPALLFAAALFVRLTYLAVVVGPRPPEGGWTSVTGDFRFFDVSGWHLANGKGYALGDGSVPTAYMPPGYSLFVGAVYRVAGRSPSAVRVAQAVLLALVAPIAFAYAAQVASRRVGVIAGAVAAVHPDFIYPIGRYQKENLFIPLLVLFAIAATRFAGAGTGASAARSGDSDSRSGRRSLVAAAAAGFLLAACALTRSEFLVAYAPVAAWLAARSADRRLPRPAPAALAAFALAALLPLAAWGARNHARLGEWIVTANGGGITLFRSLEEIAERANVEAPREPATRDDGTWTERREDRDYFDAARAWIAAHPGECLAAAPRRLWAFWGFLPVGEVFQYGPPWTRLVGLAAYGALFPLWIAGLALAWRERRGVGLFVALALYFSLVAIAFTPSARIRAPMTPLLVVFAALAIERLASRGAAARDAAA